MSAPDWLLLAAVTVCAALAWRAWRHMLKRGNGCASGCGGNCARCAARRTSKKE